MNSLFIKRLFGERNFLGVGPMAVALWGDAVIRKSDTNSV